MYDEKNIDDNYIRVRLNNLELLFTYYLYISENIEKFYNDDFSERSLSYLSYLFTKIYQEGYPITFKQEDITVKAICGIIGVINRFKQLCYEEDGILFDTPILKKLDDLKTFLNKYKDAYKSHEFSSRWIFNTNKEDLNDSDNYMADDGSIISIKNNDIKNLCRNITHSSYKTSQLLKAAVEYGGKISESYESQFNLFIKNGFVPISICKFDITRASSNWLKQTGLTKDFNLNTINTKYLAAPAEDIIFYIYMNNEYPINFNDWIQTVKYSDSYDDAKFKRDKFFNEIMEGKYD